MSNNIINNIYYNKYIKYKQKYITLDNLYGGVGEEIPKAEIPGAEIPAETLITRYLSQAKEYVNKIYNEYYSRNFNKIVLDKRIINYFHNYNKIIPTNIWKNIGNASDKEITSIVIFELFGDIVQKEFHEEIIIYETNLQSNKDYKISTYPSPIRCSFIWIHKNKLMDIKNEQNFSNIDKLINRNLYIFIDELGFRYGITELRRSYGTSLLYITTIMNIYIYKFKEIIEKDTNNYWNATTIQPDNDIFINMINTIFENDDDILQTFFTERQNFINRENKNKYYVYPSYGDYKQTIKSELMSELKSVHPELYKLHFI